MTDLEAPEGRDIGNNKSPPQYFKPQRGAILIFYLQKERILRPSGA
jgi:hypothetical protein